MTARPVEFPDTHLPNVIDLDGVGQSYDGGQTWVLRECNLLIEDKPNQGQFVVVLGISGSGKSHLLRYVAGLQQPTEGEVLIHEKPREESPPASMVFQRYSSLDWYSALRNVELPLQIRGVPKAERREQAMEMLEKVGLADHYKKFAQYPRLSGGQLQRVAIARSLIANPEIILMDEPFGALDGLTRYQMQMLLAELWLSMKSTVLFVTHDLEEAVFLGDDIYVLDPRFGKITGHVAVDLPFERTRETKHTHRFKELVLEVEDMLIRTGEPLET